MAGGLRTHYMEAGEGEPLIIVPGGGPGAAGFLGYSHFISVAAERFRVIALDPRGSGLTDKPAAEPFSFKHQGDHLHEFIEALCLRDVRLVGNSFGAVAFMRYVVDNPRNVRKVLAISAGMLAPTMGIPWENPPNIVEQEWTRETMRAFLERITRRRDEITDELVDTRVELANLPGASECAGRAARYAMEWQDDPYEQLTNDMTGRIPKLPVPLRLVFGREDKLTPPSLAEKLQALMPGLDVVWFDDAGHHVQNDLPEAFNAMAMEFLVE
jgi:pimeloyl-ACP methyl ester carboxylesterase